MRRHLIKNKRHCLLLFVLPDDSGIDCFCLPACHNRESQLFSFLPSAISCAEFLQWIPVFVSSSRDPQSDKPEVAGLTIGSETLQNSSASLFITILGFIPHPDKVDGLARGYTSGWPVRKTWYPWWTGCTICSCGRFRYWSIYSSEKCTREGHGKYQEGDRSSSSRPLMQTRYHQLGS